MSVIELVTFLVAAVAAAVSVFAAAGAARQHRTLRGLQKERSLLHAMKRLQDLRAEGVVEISDEDMHIVLTIAQQSPTFLESAVDAIERITSEPGWSEGNAVQLKVRAETKTAEAPSAKPRLDLTASFG